MGLTRWSATAFLVVGALVFAACGTAPATVAPPTGTAPPTATTPATATPTTGPTAAPDTTLTIARGADVRDLNPLRQANNATTEVTYQIHEGLVTLNPAQEIVPVLATSWELLADGFTYRIHLREGVKFHSGAPFNAEAVRYNFEKQLKTDPPGIAAGLLPRYSEINIVDEYTLEVTLEESTGTFVNILGAPLFMMVDPTRYEELGEEYNKNPSGTGPFRYVSWTPGEEVVLERNPDYWDPANAAGVGRLVFRVMPEPAARLIALRNGEIDMVFGVPAEEVDGLKADGNFEVFTTESMRVVYIGLNVLDPVLSDVRVRRAMAHAMNRDQIIDIIGANGSRADGIGMPSAVGFYPSALDFDLVEANRLLDEAGWVMGGNGFRSKDGAPLLVSVMSPRSWPGELEALQVVQNQLREAGIDFRIEQIDSAAMTARANEEAGKNVADPNYIPNYQGFVVGDGIRTGEVGYITERPKCDQGARGWERYCDEEFDEAFDLSQSTASVEEREVGYRKMAELFERDVMRLPLFVINQNIAAGNYVQGFDPNPNDSLSLRGVTINR